MNKDCKIVWDQCLQFIKTQVSEQSFKTWFQPIVPYRFEDKVLTIQVPSQFFYEWLEEHYLSLLRKVIDKELGPGGKLEYSIIVDKGSADQKAFTINLPTHSSTYFKQENSNDKTSKDGIRSPFELVRIGKEKHASHLSPHHTFDTLIEGDCNQLAKSAAQAVAKKPGNTSFNPLVIYGGVGLGKTHIVQALGNAAKGNFSNKFVLYVSSEKFTPQFI